MPRSVKTDAVMGLLKKDGGGVNPNLSAEVKAQEKPKRTRKPSVPKDKPETTQKEETQEQQAPPQKITLAETRHQNPALMLPENDAPTGFIRRGNETLIVNIVTMLINESMGTVLERFSICTCGRCLLGITNSVLKEVPTSFVYVMSQADVETVNEQLELYRPKVIKALTRAAIAAKSKPPHDIL